MLKRILTLIIAVLWLFMGQAQARLSIEITQGIEGALPIAVLPFGGAAVPEDIAAIIRDDLRRSGLFAPLAEDQWVQLPQDAGSIRFPAWRNNGTENLVIGKVEPQGQRFLVQFQLFDVVRGVQLAGYSIPTAADALRRAAHQVSDLIYQQLTGQRGAFDTHIAYVTVEELGEGKRRYRLEVADADGYNEQVILTSQHPLMSPAWSPDGRYLAYVSFEEGRSAIYLQEVTTGEREKLASYKGLNGAPVFSPDGKRLALTLSRDGNPEIYLLELASRRLQRITRNYAIDTEAAFSPDGKHLVFTSDRGGRPQIYQVALGPNGKAGKPRRLTFEGGYNARAVFSADGQKLALVHGSQGRFRIGVLDLPSGKFNVLTDTRLDESPSFAPNGSMILYATEQNNRGVLAAVSVDGQAHQRLGLQRGDVREPAWSPYMSQ